MQSDLPAHAIARLVAWEGRTETLADTITPAPLRGLAATLDREEAPAVEGSEVPALGHWMYFLPQHPQHEIGDDGHPRRGGFLPPVPLPRRMWAGGRLQWHAPLRVGDEAVRASRIERVSHKAGRSGDLVFVLVRHVVSNAAGPCITEEHDIVYRRAQQPGDAPPAPVAAPAAAAFSREVHGDPVLLFRYSALTFNGHRIHYDRSYVTGVEGYPGLVVHGPLIATLLVDLVRRQLPGAALVAFEFKAVRPIFDLHPFRICGQPSADGRTVDLWAQDHEGWLCMQARATLAAPA